MFPLPLPCAFLPLSYLPVPSSSFLVTSHHFFSSFLISTSPSFVTFFFSVFFFFPFAFTLFLPLSHFTSPRLPKCPHLRSSSSSSLPLFYFVPFKCPYSTPPFLLLSYLICSLHSPPSSFPLPFLFLSLLPLRLHYVLIPSASFLFLPSCVHVLLSSSTITEGDGLSICVIRAD